MKNSMMRQIAVMMIALSVLLLSVPTWHSPTAAQNATVSITLLFPEDEAGNRNQLTIRVDNDIDTLDLSTMNFHWIVNANEQRFDLNSTPQLISLSENLLNGQCIQLYPINPDLIVPLCTNVLPYPVRPQEVFWSPQLTVLFNVYQNDTLIWQCSTAIDRCTFDWPLPTSSTSPTIIGVDDPTPSVTPIDGSPDPNLVIYATPDSLTLYIAADEPISLAGFQYYVTYGIDYETFDLASWDALRLTSYIAQPHDCYILKRQDAEDIPPNDCAEIFELSLNDADVFWYDSVRNQGRSIAILNGTLPVVTCPALTTGCTFTYETQPPTPTPTATRPATATPTPSVTPNPTNTVSPGGHHLLLFYDQTNFYVWNRERTGVLVSRIRFEAVQTNDIPTGREFDGDFWAEFYAILEENDGCVEIDVSAGTRRPPECRVINSTVEYYADPFWTPHDNAVGFIVYWDDVEVGRCLLATGATTTRCDVYVDP